MPLMMRDLLAEIVMHNIPKQSNRNQTSLGKGRMHHAPVPGKYSPYLWKDTVKTRSVVKKASSTPSCWRDHFDQVSLITQYSRELRNMQVSSSKNTHFVSFAYFVCFEVIILALDKSHTMKATSVSMKALTIGAREEHGMLIDKDTKA